MTPPQLERTTRAEKVWHVGFRPDVWAWSDWRYATDNGRFDGRWDDQDGNFRTIYTADSLYACLLEVLAKYRPARSVEDQVMAVDDRDGHGALFPDYPAGELDHSWLNDRLAGHATQDGVYCYITHSTSVAALRRRFNPADYGMPVADFDAALLKDSAPRALTRSIASWLYELSGTSAVDGVEFRSRHGDDLRMWAIFERPNDPDISPRLTNKTQGALTPDTPELRDAMTLHGLRWS
ncbi:RES domain-containing protein [Subtercola boreus]|uniref:RES domain-containing protein n=1 Tax=Subtercola boreus TaxID=120213 RepID=A0A3E0W7C2_9MICO|nr:RES domain-containing protein [Subtercola boreus]RFA17725.1 hypothetical protein B7R24_16555 [Subtercola boreus]RFA17734.1 hypothetical protein B7R23_16725 [Subtercola boreus]RFA24480.1 hypothetical protein B7R25_16720 [Subtercola boreus]